MEFEKTVWPNLQNKVLSAILSDDLEAARHLASKDQGGLKLISELLHKVTGKPVPLANATAEPPKEIHTAVSYTCGIGCQMCGSGFADRASIFDNYKYLSTEQFDQVLPWIQTAEHIAYVGTGETLDNPHIYDFVQQANGKETK
ncbi:MAG: hypothetical protein V3U37_07215, partial [Nitrospinaceae bacterium]